MLENNILHQTICVCDKWLCIEREYVQWASQQSLCFLISLSTLYEYCRGLIEQTLHFLSPVLQDNELLYE